MEKKRTIHEALEALSAGSLSSVSLVEEMLEQIEKKDEEVHAFLEVFDDALKQAKDADAKRAKGGGGALLGIPIAIKDNILIKGKVASAASKMLENYTATYDATAIEKLKDAGAVLIGRTNMDEFAMGGSTENSAFGPTHNPLDTSRVPGGSSGGSAAAVAMGAALGALGSDTGGSIRQPASYCGIVGLKPTYGSVSRYGLIAMGSSLDQIGPMTNSVADAELLFSVIRGHDKKDSTSLKETAQKDGASKKIGVPRALLELEGLDSVVRERFNEGLEKLKSAGYEIVDVDLPSAKYALSMYYIIMPAEASTNLARFDGVRYGLHIEGDTLMEDYALSRGEGFGKEVRRRVLLGTYVLSAGYFDAYYGKATALRRLMQKEFHSVLEAVDAIATPTAPTPAFKIGEKEDPLSMYLQDIFTVSANLTGMPALSVPVGTVSEGGVELSVGFQLIGNHNSEHVLFEAGKIVEGGTM